MIMSKGHHTTLLWNVFISSVSRTTLKKIYRPTFSSLFFIVKGYNLFFFSFIYKYLHKSKISSSHVTPLCVISLSFLTEQPWSNRYHYTGVRHGRFCLQTSTGLYRANGDSMYGGKQTLIFHLVEHNRATACYWSG